MLLEEAVRAAMERLLRRLPGGEVHSHSVGESNVLQGHAVYLDYPVGDRKLRLLLLFLAKEGGYAYHHCLSWRPDWDYDIMTLLSGLDLQPQPPEDWDQELARFEPEIRQSLGKGPPPLPKFPQLPAFPEKEYPLVAAALRERMQAWKFPRLYLQNLVLCPDTPRREKWETLQSWCPRLSSQSLKAHAQRGEYQLDLGLFGPSVGAAEFDILDLYRTQPQAHGRLSVSAPGYREDGQQAVMVLEHEVGFWPIVGGTWEGPTPTPPDGARPRPFQELLVMELLDGQWKIAERLECELPSPPWEREAKVRARLQAELGDWAQVGKLVFNERQLSQVWLQRGDEAWRVISGRELAFSQGEKVFLEPTLWVPDGPITGAAIRKAHANPAT